MTLTEAAEGETKDSMIRSWQPVTHLTLISFVILQGLVLGPVLFVLYTASLSTIIKKHSVLHHS